MVRLRPNPWLRTSSSNRLRPFRRWRSKGGPRRCMPLRRHAEARDHRLTRRASVRCGAGGRTRRVLRYLRRSGMSAMRASARGSDGLARRRPLRRRQARIERRRSGRCCFGSASRPADASTASVCFGRSIRVRVRESGAEAFGPLRRSRDGDGEQPTSGGEQAPETAHGSARGRKL